MKKEKQSYGFFSFNILSRQYIVCPFLPFAQLFGYHYLLPSCLDIIITVCPAVWILLLPFAQLFGYHYYRLTSSLDIITV